MGSFVAALVAFVAIAVAISLFAGHRGKAAWAGIWKMAASCGFLLIAWRSGAAHTSFGITIFIGLCFSWWGDLFLISNKRAIFLAGLVSFLLAHVAYVIAFFTHGVAWVWCIAAIGVLLLPIAAIRRWLGPHLTSDMRAPVYAYMTVISIMLILATGAYGAGGTSLLPIGALAFYISDIFVARERFVSPGYANHLYGLPLYFLGQVLLALSTT